MSIPHHSLIKKPRSMQLVRAIAKPLLACTEPVTDLAQTSVKPSKSQAWLAYGQRSAGSLMIGSKLNRSNWYRANSGALFWVTTSCSQTANIKRECGRWRSLVSIDHFDGTLATAVGRTFVFKQESGGAAGRHARQARAVLVETWLMMVAR